MNDVILLLFDENIFLILLENIDEVFLELNVMFNFTYGMMYLLTEYSTHLFCIFYDF
jgi:hypothetical protein